MAITEANRLKKEAETREDKIQFLKDLIKAAARYERITVNPDFKEIMADLKRLADVHKNQIQGWLDQLEGSNDVDAESNLAENPMMKQLRIFEVVKTHQYRLNQLREAIAYPDKLIHTAINARAELKAMIEEENSNATRSN